MPDHQIPSAFLIRALARREAQHCDRCGQRMYVKGPSGLCPFCRADRPVRPVEHAHTALATTPFAPRLGAPSGWQRPALTVRVRDWVQRPRRAGKQASAALGMHAPHGEAHG